MQHSVEVGTRPVGRLLVTQTDDALTIENVKGRLRHTESGTADRVLWVSDTETEIDVTVGIRQRCAEASKPALIRTIDPFGVLRLNPPNTR